MLRIQTILLTGLLLLQVPALAYIPPGWFLIKNVSQKKKGFKWVRVRSSIQEIQSNEQLGEKLKVTTIIDYEKETLKTSIALESGAVLENKEVALSHAQVGVGAVLLFANHAETIAAALKQQGLSVLDESAPGDVKELSFLTRAGDRIAWGLGNRELPPQLWVEKDKFLPVKLIGKINGEAAEINFGPFQFSREFPYATQTDVRVGSMRFKETFEDALVLNSAEKDKRKTIEPVKASPSDAQSKLVQKYLEVLR